MNFSVKKVKES